MKPIHRLVRLHRFAQNRNGATIIEFALILPAMMMMMMGLGDVLYQMYAQEILAGSIQKAGRDSGIQGGAQKTSDIDNQVLGMMTSIMPRPRASCASVPAGGTFCSSRQAYAMFASAGPEPFSDDNNNGMRDSTECYQDMNNNGSWDASPSPGAGGQGGASDVALYRLSITYARLFPVAGLLGMGSTQTISAQTLLKNQPYATRSEPTVTTRCT